MNYTVGDFLIRLKNAYMARKANVNLPYSKENLAIGQLLVKEGYLKSIAETKVENHTELIADLIYKNRSGAIENIDLVSKPSLHRFARRTKIPRTLKGAGLTVISTSKGIMSDKEALKQKIGGEIICKIY